uniref:Adaptin_N domain-containing protein n=1 Tax=Mesocestoides corti TaxID=53468 RepID=A0A5K3G3R1_MESCO
MLVRCDGGGVPDPVFQQAYYTSKPVSFIKIAADELLNATPDCHHLKIWLLLALGRLWFRCDEARWHAVQSEVNIIDDVLFRFLGDPSPGVRAAAVFALGNLIDNYSSEPGLIHEAEILNREVGVRLVEKTLDPSPLVRCELVVALCGFVYQYESRLVEQAYYHYQDVLQMLRTQPSPPLAQEASSAHAQGSPVAAAQFGSPSGATSLWRGVAEFGISRFNLIRSRSQRDLRRAGNGLALSQHQTDSLGVYEVSVFVQDDSPTASKSIFAQLWDTIVTLASDPHPSVAKLANIILVYIIQKLIRKVSHRKFLVFTAAPQPPPAPLVSGLLLIAMATTGVHCTSSPCEAVFVRVIRFRCTVQGFEIPPDF